MNIFLMLGGEKKMKKTIVYVLAVFVFALFPSISLAQSQQQNRVQDPSVNLNGSPSASGNQVQNQNQLKTQNMGEEQQLMVMNQQMQALMAMEGLDEETGAMVRTIAQEQVQAQAQIQTELNKLSAKSAFMKKLFGADQKAIKNLKAQVEQNRLRIQNLTQLKNQLMNQGESMQLQEAIQAMTAQNTYLQNQIQAEEKAGGIFGWLLKLFS